jgi:hypothetical protein
MDKAKATSICKEMLNRRYNQQTKRDLQQLLELIEADKLPEAYRFVNYQQVSRLEYRMPGSLWDWLINNQNTTL